MREADLQDAILDVARLGGWRVAHFGAARTVDGWRTPARADAAGWPDLILAKPGRPLLAWELKSEAGRATAEQQAWLDLLGQVERPRPELVRPRDLDWAINELLGRSDDDDGTRHD